MPSSTTTRLPLSTYIIVFVCSIAPFFSALEAGFLNWDDTFLIAANPAIRGLGWVSIADWFTSFYVHHYHPVVMFTYAVEHSIAGSGPTIYHATNLLLHGLNSLLVLALLHHFVSDRIVLAIAVLFFALHPLRTEPVMWIAARKDLLSTFFILISVLAFIRFMQSGKGGAMILSVLAAILASLSKAIAVVLPFLLMTLLHTFHHQTVKRPLRVLAPFVVVAIITAVTAIAGQYSSGHAPYDPTHSLLRALTVPFWNILFYAVRSLLPLDLSAVYPYPENGGPELLGPSLIALVAVSMTTVVVILLKPGRPVIFGLGWILICLAPILQWVPVGRAFAADRFTYLPAIGLSLLLALFLDRIAQRDGRSFRPLVRRAGVLVLAVLGTVSYIRTEVWHDSVSLWTSVLERYPEYAEGHVYIGSAFAVEERNIPLAIAAFTESIRLDDRNANAYSNRALAVYQSTDPDTALIISDLQRAIALDPREMEHQVFLAEIYQESGLTDRALEMSAAILDMEPMSHRARFLHLRCALELGLDEIVQEDIRVLSEAGMEVSIETSGRERR